MSHLPPNNLLTSGVAFPMTPQKPPLYDLSVHNLTYKVRLHPCRATFFTKTPVLAVHLFPWALEKNHMKHWFFLCVYMIGLNSSCDPITLCCYLTWSLNCRWLQEWRKRRWRRRFWTMFRLTSIRVSCWQLQDLLAHPRRPFWMLWQAGSIPRASKVRFSSTANPWIRPSSVSPDMWCRYELIIRNSSPFLHQPFLSHFQWFQWCIIAATRRGSNTLGKRALRGVIHWYHLCLN